MKLFTFLRGEAFARGIHPPQHKDTAEMPITRVPFAPRLIVPLSQNVGRPAKAVVKVGQEVVRGQPLAEADGFVSVPHHAPVSGVVEAIRLNPTSSGPWTESVIIKSHAGSTQAVEWEEPQDLSALDAAGVIAAVQRTGIVGLGGGIFPTHAKLRVPKEFPVDTLVVNGCECEPYLTSDHRIMLERASDIMKGVALSRRLLGNPRAIIGVEDNKLDAIEALRAALPESGEVTVEAVPTKYPQGAGEMLIKTLLNREVPPDARSYSVGAYVQNVATLAYMGALAPRGRGFIERVITVAGTAVERPGNYLVPMGTPLRFLLDYVGAPQEAIEVIYGGPMMGQAVACLDAPITKGVSGILVFRARDLTAPPTRKSFPCIKCGKCIESCPMGLNPSTLGMLAAKRQYEPMADTYRLGACFECGTCSYVCPANIPLVQQFRVAKQVLRGSEKAA
ncbi:electron transport complex subunit RsxC [Rhodoblastus sphagnicola]|uniref:Ion-translocating oxidoreductase complex subunit C n=1 Tax=Rhodoblastus sphagnicola TaxID=333368 RepID=A0A2S6NDA0_9HYPH|nr:electron transport complex subunit RsxC [Rhodoblastus sphagnicola]MBB4198021.1 electron transport complex protein RnfC [Rhodoblastus sphagnicola]PPQ32615.1 electron transport complex subunit RsxC [Rhodoblastus sphagnicola]